MTEAATFAQDRLEQLKNDTLESLGLRGWSNDWINGYRLFSKLKMVPNPDDTLRTVTIHHQLDWQE